MHWVSHNMHEKLHYCAVIILKKTSNLEIKDSSTLLAHYWCALIGVSAFWNNIFMFFLSGCVLSEGHHYSHSCSSPAHLPLLWQPHLECGPQGELDPQVPLLWYQGPFQEGRHSVCDMFLTFMYWRIDNQLHKLEYIIWNEISCSECQYNFFVGDPHHSFCLHWPDNSARYKYLRKTVYGWQMFFFVCVFIVGQA